jgi:ribosomal protein S18 acetylase RimI-like enzyme
MRVAIQNHVQEDSSRPPEILIRPAMPSDAPRAAALIHLPMDVLANYLFGADDPARAIEVLEKLFALPSNRFSHEFSDVLEMNEEVVGLVISYPSEILKELAVPMGNQLRELTGVNGMFRVLKRSIPLMREKETEPDEYYVCTLAVQTEFQSHGLGAHLLAHAESKALGAGLRKSSLQVTLNNGGARRFYERHGYRVMDTIPIPKLEKAIGYPGYWRMVKDLNANAASQ